MVMADYFVQDRLQELWQQINHSHLTYLDTEDSPQKIEQRNKLEGNVPFVYLVLFTNRIISSLHSRLPLSCPAQSQILLPGNRGSPPPIREQ